MSHIPGYDAWKLAAPEGPYPCDHCHEDFCEDDIVLIEAGQFCKDCVPCELCGENVGEAQLDDFAEICKSCAEDRAQFEYDELHSSGGVA